MVVSNLVVLSSGNSFVVVVVVVVTVVVDLDSVVNVVVDADADVVGVVVVAVWFCLPSSWVRISIKLFASFKVLTKYLPMVVH